MIKKEEVNRIAKLARLGLKKKEEEVFQKQLSSILDYFNFLKDVDSAMVEPTFHSTEVFLKKEKIMREDEVKSQPSEVKEKIIKALPDKKDNYVKVKSIL